MAQFAAIGSDGTREVVWGLGESAEDAESDAAQHAARRGLKPNLTRVVQVTDAIALRIENGEVYASALGL